MKVDRPVASAPSVTYNGVFIPKGDGAAAMAKLGLAVHVVSQAFAHGRPIAAVGDVTAGLAKAHVDGGGMGVPTKADATAVVGAFVTAMHQHRSRPATRSRCRRERR